MTDILPRHYANRYKATTYAELATRVCNAVASSPPEAAEFLRHIGPKNFIPAGNTLLAGIDDTISPNCCVLGTLTDGNFADKLALSRKLWRAKTGIGFDLGGMTDPVAALHALSAANADIDLGHRPARGNMAVLSCTHPAVKAFIFCKRNGALSNFNISVAVEPHQFVGELAQWIAEAAHATGDPGVVVLSRGALYTPGARHHGINDPALQPIVTCVPCGEQFMHEFETCNLGSINLNSEGLMRDNRLDPVLLEDAVRVGVYFLDRVVDKLAFVDDRLRKRSLEMRRIGLGVMGWHDYLRRCGIAYGSAESLELADKLAHTISTVATDESLRMAEILGTCYYSSQRLRNISVTCIAPTGGITGLTPNVGYAIEPDFAEALQLEPATHIAMQLAWQTHTHNAVSKTINMRADVTVADVRDAFAAALAGGCKGVTIYRDTSKANQPRALSSCASCSPSPE